MVILIKYKMTEIKPAGYVSAPTFVGAKHIKKKVDEFYSYINQTIPTILKQTGRQTDRQTERSEILLPVCLLPFCLTP